MAAVATVGPVAVAVDANTNAFRVGIYIYIDCNVPCICMHGIIYDLQYRC